jgi:hypothetical protein
MPALQVDGAAGTRIARLRNVVAAYDNFPSHKQLTPQQIAQAKAQARSSRQLRS